MSFSKKARQNTKRAQGMTEYIIIVGLIAIVLIGGIRVFGAQVGASMEQAQKRMKTDVTDAMSSEGGNKNPKPNKNG